MLTTATRANIERRSARSLLLLAVAVAQAGCAVRGFGDDWGMPMNFLACDREQVLLMPPDLRDWLPEDHLAWFVLASVEEMDLSAFTSDRG